MLRWTVRAPRTGSTTRASAALGSTDTSHQISSPTVGGRYDFVLVARNVTGDSASVSASVVVPSKPDAPRNLDAEVQTDGGLKVSWDEPAYVGTSSMTGYRLTYTVSGGSSTVSTNASTTSYTISSPTRGARYDLSVVALNSVGTSTASTTYLVVPAPPGAPRNLSWSLDESGATPSVTVSWDAPTSTGTGTVTAYGISYTVGATTGTSSLGAGARSHTITDVDPGSTYTVVVTVVTGDGSTSASMVFTVPKRPGSPRDLSAVLKTDRKIHVSWSAPSDSGTSAVTGYHLAVTVGSSVSTVALSATATSHQLGGITAGNTYTLAMSAVSAAGTGPAASVSVVVPQVPSAPKDLTAEMNALGTKLVVTWKPPSNASAAAISGYTLAWQSGSLTGSATVAPSAALQYEIASPVAGGVYALTVRSVGTMGTSSAATASFTVPSPPGAPTGLSASVVSAELVVSWSAPADTGTSALSGYGLSWTVSPDPDEDGGGDATLSATALSFTLEEPRYGSQYSFKLHAITSDGDGPAVSLSYRVPTVPGAPRSLSAAYETGSTTISWEPPSSDGGTQILGYEVSWEPNPGGAVVALTGDQRSLQVASLTEGVVYRFVVIARNAVGRGVFAALDFEVSEGGGTGRTFDDNPRALPLGLMASYLNGVMRFTWSAATGTEDRPITRYVFSWSAVDSQHFGTVILDSDAVEHEVAGLHAGEEYEIALVVVDSEGSWPPIARYITVPSAGQIASGDDLSRTIELRLRSRRASDTSTPTPVARVSDSWREREIHPAPKDLQLFRGRDRIYIYWELPIGGDPLGWTIESTNTGQVMPIILPSSARSYELPVALGVNAPAVVKVRAVYANGLSRRARSEVVPAGSDSSRRLSRSDVMTARYDLGAELAVTQGELMASIDLPAGAVLLGDSLRLRAKTAMMPRIRVPRFEIYYGGLAMRLTTEFSSRRKAADFDRDHYALLTPATVCLGLPDAVDSGDNRRVYSVVRSTNAQDAEVLDSETVRTQDVGQVCATVHALAQSAPAYYGVVSREATATGEFQRSAGMPYGFLSLALAFVGVALGSWYWLRGRCSDRRRGYNRRHVTHTRYK